jgi:hypothetical protein
MFDSLKSDNLQPKVSPFDKGGFRFAEDLRISTKLNNTSNILSQSMLIAKRDKAK